MGKLEDKIKQILDKFANYIYYEGDPKRDGIDGNMAFSAIQECFRQELLSYRREIEKHFYEKGIEKGKSIALKLAEEDKYRVGFNDCLDEVKLKIITNQDEKS